MAWLGAGVDRGGGHTVASQGEGLLCCHQGGRVGGGCCSGWYWGGEWWGEYWAWFVSALCGALTVGVCGVAGPDYYERVWCC